jgi:hypothetical protein
MAAEKTRRNQEKGDGINAMPTAAMLTGKVSALTGDETTRSTYQRSSGRSSVWRITYASISDADARSACTTRKTSETHNGIW